MAGVKTKAQFDPAAHLEKQGWKGKGTALKHGHATRPLPVVQKKSLTGIGKDRDQAVPFWDQIFATTAASLSLPSTPGTTPPPASSSSTSTSWQTLTPHGVPLPPPVKISALSIKARSGREYARRGLYGKFMRGKVLQNGGEPEVDEEEEGVVVVKEKLETREIVAGPSKLSGGLTSENNDRNITISKKTDREDKKRKRSCKDKEQVEQGDGDEGNRKSSKGEGKGKGKGKGGIREQSAIGDLDPPSQGESPVREETKEERRARRAARKASKAAARQDDPTLVVEEVLVVNEAKEKRKKKRKAEAELLNVEEQTPTEMEIKKKKRKSEKGARSTIPKV